MLFESGAPMWFWKKLKLFESDATMFVECDAPMLIFESYALK
jgi:hypothetical protein